jgi:hypothetical protein
MIGLRRTDSDERPRSLGECVRYDVFELPRLVAAKNGSGKVVPFDQDRRTRLSSERFAEARQFMYWRRASEQAESRKGHRQEAKGEPSEPKLDDTRPIIEGAVRWYASPQPGCASSRR